MKQQPKKRNPFAHILGLPFYKPKVVKSKKEYNRAKEKHKQMEKNDD